MFVCICNGIREVDVQEAVSQGASSLEDLQATLGVATCCGCCASCAESYIPKTEDSLIVDVAHL
ncbi:(2Fe-2S)-binding protein [Taylorella equigenitalis]|uniref:Bacterioferritin-associated ferredoxin n=3 Tax=Taylorella equigenitalis TaxID=29575 RepID=A0A654KGQ5_TAYEM|nr:(2Fe-2S)-binding protein [Taylorella equigenitalis]ADU91592.1 putative bacterioferritin-associated ferredoxin [Taylorella equigenitalis MCE9]AFN35132.1 bacterioferritin-associated ferredoxin [Taylorella equigenitalis ATCC 35865]ASY29829.1 bacterioferritin [Taylorella equigenitalis]ASY37132.1 bacterioferritin [Taylorella equigenitalis]ASY38576.1 bacterioferritin [Taylorella equigenitalis]